MHKNNSLCLWKLLSSKGVKLRCELKCLALEYFLYLLSSANGVQS